MVRGSRGRVDDELAEHVTGADAAHYGNAKFVEFDPKVISFEKLAAIFFKIHDPTQIDQQGPDVGDQYRSEIFTFSDAQAKTAASVRDQLQAEVRLDLVACLRLDGAAEVGQYFTRYAALADLQALPLAGTAALTIEDREGTYPVLLAWAGGEITRICDYRYAREQGRALLAGL